METGMGMNIKNERVERLARDLARETGESLTTAIERALEDRLERLARSKEREWRYQRIREIVSSLPPTPPGVTSDHSDLYDDDGLPA
jgi:antitoxin VapB